MNQAKIHTIQQPDCDITAFILSCNRLHLLRRTFTSFINTRDLPTKIVIVDDSGEEGIYEQLVNEYGHMADVICFPKNRGLWWAKDFMVSYCDSPYIMYIEEDWLFLNTGYLAKSKNILEKDRTIGSIDLSWRTFEEEGFDSYDPVLVDGEYYHKKPWRISENHLHWFCWQGSPNLKRREDLLLLGRVEGFYTEWNIDRKFYALGLRGVFLNQRYVMHLGDYESIMVNKRRNEGGTPESLFPSKLLPNRSFPQLDYYGMDRLAVSVRGDSNIFRTHDFCLVTCILDIGRDEFDNRDFLSHYLDGLCKIIQLPYPLVIFADSRYYESIMAITGGKKIAVVPISPNIIKDRPYYNKLVEICGSEAFYNQSEWMKDSIIKSPDYIGLTIHKMELLMHCVRHNLFRSDNYYWIDAGICSSYGIESLENYDFNLIPKTEDRVFITTFPYQAVSEIHGYSLAGYQEVFGSVPSNVYRATLFGGSKSALHRLNEIFNTYLTRSLEKNYIGTEESLFSGIAVTNPQVFESHLAPTGDIKHYLAKIDKNARL